MGRPRLGRSAKILPASTKISAHERAYLIGKFGTVYKGLRVALSEHMHRVDDPASAVVSDADVGVDEQTGRCRVHQAYVYLDSWYDQGTKYTKKRCDDCGYETVVAG